MEKVGEDEEKIVGEESNSVEETRSNKEVERSRDTIAERFDLVDYTEEDSMDPSNSQTVTFEDHHVSECEMEDEKVLELFRRNISVKPKIAERNKFPYLNNSEEMVLQFQEDTPTETEQTDVVFHSMSGSIEIGNQGAVNLNSPEILEGNKSSSASTEDIEDSSSNSDIDSSLSRYYFDGYLPVSAHVEEPETHQEESPVPKDENQMPLLCPKQPVQQPTSWRNCCGLLELLWGTDP